jgi:hypothetical protein
MDITSLLNDNIDVLQYSLPNAGRMNRDLGQGLINVRIFRDKLTFAGKTFNDPQIELRFADIKSLHIEFGPENKIYSVRITGSPSRAHYKVDPGLDL